MIGTLPKSLEVNGNTYDIRTDYRDILKILCAFSDPELEDKEKIYVCLYILYKDFNIISQSNYQAAFTAALKFIDSGMTYDKAKPLHVMDWEQDEALVFPAINKVAGFETRTSEYIHWWTFLGYYMEISEGVFSHILSMRIKKAKHKKLEKWEHEYWNANKNICVLKPKISVEEQKAKDRLNALLG